PGYFLDENTNLQANTLSAKITSMTISSNAAGSVIMGLHFVGSLSISARNVTIARNRIEITTIYTDGISVNNSIGNVTIMQNYITSSHASAYRAIYVGSSDSNIVIRNNFIENLSTGYGPIEASSILVASDVSNNVLYGVGSLTLHTASFNNNIIRSGSLTLTGVTPYNNICNSTQLAAYSSAPYSNQNSVSMTSVFVTSGTSDTKWQLSMSGGPTSGTGFGGVDCGMYDNSAGTAYIPSGIPPIPSIYQFDASDLNNVTVKVKSHN
ncbi:MAG TPA: hypothetical protein PLH27_09960, partial [bacterium]|nr:hypothetical protein [bacterium]